MEYVYMLLLMGVVIALCIFINRVTDKLKIPSLLLFIALGMLFGVLLRPQIGNFTDYGLGNVVCSICLVFVIFYGGFGTNFREAKPVAPQALLLSFAGTALTAGIVGVFVYYVFRLLPFFDGGIGWVESLLIGSVISSTDAASVFNILRTRRLNLKYRTSSLLEMESGSNDPTSYMLTFVFTAVLAAQYGVAESALSAGEIVGMIFSQVGFGAVAGVGFGFLGIFVLKRFSFNMGQGGTIFILALSLVTYALPTVLGEVTGVSVLSGNGYLAVYICGIMLGNARIPQKRDCVRFFDALTGVAQMMIFFLLGLLATPEWLIQPQYREAGEFGRNGLAPVAIEVGVISGEGNVSTRTEWIFINEKGEELKLDEFAPFGTVRGFGAGDLAAVNFDNKWGFIDGSGNTVIPRVYDDIAERDITNIYPCDLAGVSKDGNWGCVDAANNIVIPFKYDQCIPVSENMIVGIKDGEYVILNRKNKTLKTGEYGGEYVAADLGLILFYSDTEYQWIDFNGKIY